MYYLYKVCTIVCSYCGIVIESFYFPLCTLDCMPNCKTCEASRCKECKTGYYVFYTGDCFREYLSSLQRQLIISHKRMTSNTIVYIKKLSMHPKKSNFTMYELVIHFMVELSAGVINISIKLK